MTTVPTKYRTKMMEQNPKLSDYNKFCNKLNEGDILYNLDKSNSWGEYLLVAAKSSIILGGNKTYFILLLGLDEMNSKLKANNLRVNITPDKVDNVAYLKFVGHCDYSFQSILVNEEINSGLVSIYKKTNLWKFNQKFKNRKPRISKYDTDGSLRIKHTSNSK